MTEMTETRFYENGTDEWFSLVAETGRREW